MDKKTWRSQAALFSECCLGHFFKCQQLVSSGTWGFLRLQLYHSIPPRIHASPWSGTACGLCKKNISIPWMSLLLPIQRSTLVVSMSPPKVAIIGAGPVGRTLACLLIRASISVTIFEGEYSMSIREQGEPLDLQTSTGLKALREAGLYEGYA